MQHFLESFMKYKAQTINEVGEATVPAVAIDPWEVLEYGDNNYIYVSRFKTTKGNQYGISFTNNFAGFNDLIANPTGKELQDLKAWFVRSGLRDEDVRIFDIQFYDEGTGDSYAETNRGEMYEVISTVMKAMHEITDKEKSIPFLGLMFEGNHKKDKILDREDSVRTKWYMRYVEQHLPSNFKCIKVQNGALLYRIL
jgi:hypothetical protein